MSPVNVICSGHQALWVTRLRRQHWASSAGRLQRLRPWTDLRDWCNVIWQCSGERDGEPGGHSPVAQDCQSSLILSIAHFSGVLRKCLFDEWVIGGESWVCRPVGASMWGFG